MFYEESFAGRWGEWRSEDGKEDSVEGAVTTCPCAIIAHVNPRSHAHNTQ